MNFSCYCWLIRLAGSIINYLIAMLIVLISVLGIGYLSNSMLFFPSFNQEQSWLGWFHLRSVICTSFWLWNASYMLSMLFRIAFAQWSGSLSNFPKCEWSFGCYTKSVVDLIISVFPCRKIGLNTGVNLCWPAFFRGGSWLSAGSDSVVTMKTTLSYNI